MSVRVVQYNLLLSDYTVGLSSNSTLQGILLVIAGSFLGQSFKILSYYTTEMGETLIFVCLFVCFIPSSAFLMLSAK